jgi:glucosamine--fructose-6-phosphate aminotransferase (isomerizing)
MHPDLAVIAGEYLRDLLGQSQALERTLNSFERSAALERIAAGLHKGKFQRIVLTGMGSSFHALHPLSLQLIDRRHTAILAETSELVHYKNRFFGPGTLVIAVSQSGRSAEMVRLLKVNRGRSSVIAITNTPESPLALQADVAIVTQAGNEFSVSCKTYLAALMALVWLGDALIGRDLRRTRRDLKKAAPAVKLYMADWESKVRSLLEKLKDIRHLFLVGRGASLAAVGTGALIVKEAARFPAEGMSSAAFRHGPFETLSDKTFVLVFSGDRKTRDLNLRLLRDIQKRGGKAELVSEDALFPAFRLPATPAWIRPILEILPVQMITLALAAQAGREPGRFEVVVKVTTTE